MSIFKINENKEEPKITEIYYTLYGDHDGTYNGFPILENDNPDKVHAKEVFTDENNYYFIKVGLDGRLYNPLNIFTGAETFTPKKRQGQQMWKLKKVKREIFFKYIQFLNTRNIAYLKNAEREVL